MDDKLGHGYLVGNGWTMRQWHNVDIVQYLYCSAGQRTAGNDYQKCLRVEQGFIFPDQIQPSGFHKLQVLKMELVNYATLTIMMMTFDRGDCNS